jgi:ADP-heptose:LPS heptosyltransferase
MNLKAVIRFLKTSPLMVPVLALIDFILWSTDQLAVWSVGRVKVQPDTLVILKFDVLGDYVTLRNYLRYLKTHSHYGEYAFTLCGNAAFRTLAEAFDADLFTSFIWIDIYKLSTRPLYRFRFVRQLRKRGFAVAFCPTHSRVLVLDDFLAQATGAPTRIGCQGDRINLASWEALYGNRCYSRLLPSQPGIVFEPERNRQTLEAWLGYPVPVQPITVPTESLPAVAVGHPYVVLSLGAGQAFRVWPANRFAAVVSYLQQHYPDVGIVLTGAPGEEVYAQALWQQLTNLKGLDDMTGRLSLLQLISLLDKASLLIANETGTVHLAAAVNTPAIVVSQGKSLVRWHPYPAELTDVIHYVYPPDVEAHHPDLRSIADRFNPESPLSINDIAVDRVTAEIQSLLPVQQRID